MKSCSRKSSARSLHNRFPRFRECPWNSSCSCIFGMRSSPLTSLPTSLCRRQAGAEASLPLCSGPGSCPDTETSHSGACGGDFHLVHVEPCIVSIPSYIVVRCPKTINTETFVLAVSGSLLSGNGLCVQLNYRCSETDFRVLLVHF